MQRDVNTMNTYGLLTVAIIVTTSIWGYYYYEEFYIPSGYAAAVVPLYQTVPRAVNVLHLFPSSDEMNFIKAENVLNEQCNTFDSTKQKLAGIQPPMQGEFVHQYFQETLDVLGKACHTAITKVEQVGSINAFLAEFEKIFTLEENSNRASGLADDSAAPVIRTIGDLQQIWGGQMKAAGEAGRGAFDHGLTGIDEKTVDILMKEWERIQPNLATMITVLKNLTTSLSAPVEEAERHIAPSQLQAAEKAIRELEKSRDALMKIHEQPEFSISVLDIVNFRSLEGVSQTEISEHLYALARAMEELEARY